MKKAVKIIIIIFFLGFLAIQFYRPARTNPANDPAREIAGVPDNVHTILKNSCYDCHSNNTDWRWYSNFQPALSFMQGHVEEGRSELNFSEWNTYDAGRKSRKLDEICEMIESREMPLPSYLWIHWDLELSQEQIKTICDWTKTEIEKIKAAS